jgi:hypothetical protein
MNTLLKILCGMLFFYAAYCAFLFFMQRQILFPRGLIPTPPQPEGGLAGIEKIWLDTPSGKIEAWFLPPVPDNSSQPAPAVIFGHGNGELIDFWPDSLKRFSEIGLGLLLVEYPGYGRSAGSPSQKSITEAFVAAYDNLAGRKDTDPERIIFFGRSLGGAAVCALTAHRPSAALILMSAFTRVRDFTSRYLAPAFLVRDPFDNLAAVQKYRKPVLIIHGRNDTIIPYSHGQALHRASRLGKLIPYPAGHNDCPPDWKIFWQDIETFLLDIGII